MPSGVVGSSPTLVCSVCNTTYKTRPSRLKRAKKNCCSVSCARVAQQIPKNKVSCARCGKPVVTRKGVGGRVFCSRKCFGKFQTEQAQRHRNPKASLRRAEKRALREAHGVACFICGFDRAIDWCHIIPRRNGGGAGKENVIPLCPNHHRLFDRQELTPKEQAAIAAYL